MDVLFPMAGQGARFGHKFKPFLRIGDEPFIQAAVRPFLPFVGTISRFVFVYLEQQERDFAVSAELARMFDGIPFTTVRLPSPTRGPAETITRAVHELGLTGRAFICDCDHSLDVAPLFDVVERGERYDVLLPVWPLEAETIASWSVAMVESGRVLAIGEKCIPDGSRGTAMGVIGCYGFREIGDIARRADAISATNFSDVISQMLTEDAVVRAARIERAIFFGDPQRLEHAQMRGSV